MTTRTPINIKAGDSLIMEFTLVEADGSASNLVGATVRWGIAPVLAGAAAAFAAPVLEKTLAAGVAVTGNIVRVTLGKGEVAAGRYHHELEITLANGDSTTPFDGPFTAHAAVFPS